MAIEELQLKIEADASESAKSLDSLAASLAAVGESTKNNAGLNTDAVKPLAAEMEKISMGFSAMPTRIQRFITQMDKSGKSATTAAQGYKSAANSLVLLNNKLNIGVLYAGLRRISGLRRVS